MKVSIVLTAFVASFALGRCQFQLQGFLQRRSRDDHAVSSSFFSSSSWFMGQDGHMHKQTKSSTSQLNEDGSQTKKKLLCRDGDCEEVMEVVSAGRPQAPCPMDPARYAPVEQPQQLQVGRAEMLLNLLMQRMQRSREEQQLRWQRQQEREEQLLRWQRQQEPSIVIDVERMPPRAVPVHPDQPMRVIEIPFQEFRNFRTPQVQQAAPKPVDANMIYLKIGAAVCALVTAYVVVMSVLKYWRADQASARERPLREMAQPLATPQTQAVLAPAVAIAPKFNPVRSYLCNLYERASAIDDARSVRMYLSNVYNRATA